MILDDYYGSVGKEYFRNIDDIWSSTYILLEISCNWNVQVIYSKFRRRLVSQDF